MNEERVVDGVLLVSIREDLLTICGVLKGFFDHGDFAMLELVTRVIDSVYGVDLARLVFLRFNDERVDRILASSGSLEIAVFTILFLLCL